MKGVVTWVLRLALRRGSEVIDLLSRSLWAVWVARKQPAACYGEGTSSVWVCAGLKEPVP